MHPALGRRGHPPLPEGIGGSRFSPLSKNVSTSFVKAAAWSIPRGSAPKTPGIRAHSQRRCRFRNWLPSGVPTAVPADHPTDVSPTSDGALPEASEPAPDVRAPVCCGWGRCESFVFLVVRLETSSARIRWWFRARPAIALLHRDVDQSSGSGRPDQLGLADLVGSTHLGFIWDFGSGAYRRARSEPASRQLEKTLMC